MDDIFLKEEKIIVEAENLLLSGEFFTAADAGLYQELLEEYKKLLKQMRSLVKMSDITQGKLNSMSFELERLSNIDELTSLYNRRYFNEKYEKEWFNACLSQSSLGVLMIDIDYFKKYNDTYGHFQGDKCLREIAETLKQTANGADDCVARFGGEEFIILLPAATLNDCASLSEKILKNISSLDYHYSNEAPLVNVTVSIGISSIIPNESINMDVLLNDADAALYKAKEDGRNCYRAI